MINVDNVKDDVRTAVDDLRKNGPVVSSMTNFVTMNFVANAQLAVGANAAMVHNPEEPALLNEVAGATYINVGTLIPVCKETLANGAKAALETGKPWVLDPVAAGLGDLRTYLLNEFKQYKPTIIRGNASEIITLAKMWGLDGAQSDTGVVKGVDSTDDVASAHSAAIALARHTGGAVAVSGECDLITDGVTTFRTKGGSHLMTRITGSGCSLGGVIASYAAVSNPLIAALTGTLIYNYAGSVAQNRAKGTGSFQVEFIDALYNATADDVLGMPFTVDAKAGE